MLYSFNITAFFSCYFMFLCVQPSYILIHTFSTQLDFASYSCVVFTSLLFIGHGLFHIFPHTLEYRHTQIHALTHTFSYLLHYNVHISKLYFLHYMQRCKFRKITLRLCMQVMKYLHSFFKD